MQSCVAHPACFFHSASFSLCKAVVSLFFHPTWPSCVHNRNLEKPVTTALEYERVIREVAFPYPKLHLHGSKSHKQHPTDICTKSSKSSLNINSSITKISAFLPTPTSLRFGDKDSLEVCRSKHAVLGRNKTQVLLSEGWRGRPAVKNTDEPVRVCIHTCMYGHAHTEGAYNMAQMYRNETSSRLY